MATLRITDAIAIPLAELELSYVRAGGPGGQNVNKVASKAVLRFDLRHSPSLPEVARRRALARLASRLTNDGVLVLAAAEHRDQSRNRAAAIERLQTLLSAAVTPPKRRRPTKPSAASRERRLETKKARAKTKRTRGRIDE